MAFPTALDNFTNPTGTAATDSGTRTHSQQHGDVNDAVEALEAKVGINGSAVTTTLDYKLSGVTGSDKAVSKTGTETLTNKTLTSPTINTPTIATPTITSASITNKTSTGTDTGAENLSNKTLTVSTLQGNNNVAVVTQKDSGGTARNVLKVSSSDVLEIGSSSLLSYSVKATIPRVSFRKSSTQSAADVSFTSIQWDVETTKTGMTHSTVTNKERVTIVYDGIYDIFCRMNFTASGSGNNSLYLFVNGTETIQFATAPLGGVAGSIKWTFAVGDYFEIKVYQDSGSSKTIGQGTASYNPYLIVYKIA